jgi:tetratricopeptide (TPR) repeat protein
MHPLIAGLKDASARLWKRSKLAAARAAALAGDAPRALGTLRDLQSAMAAAGDVGACAIVEAGDVHFEAAAYPQAKQSYRRALQIAPSAATAAAPSSSSSTAALPPRALLRLAECFFRSGDVTFAADTYEVAAAARPGVAAYLGLAAARGRLGDFGAADAAHAAASRLDPRHPRVWGRVALLALQQGREEEGAQVGTRFLHDFVCACGHRVPLVLWQCSHPQPLSARLSPKTRQTRPPLNRRH